MKAGKWLASLNTNHVRAVGRVVGTAVVIILVVMMMAAVIAGAAVITSFLVEFGNHIRHLKGL